MITKRQYESLSNFRFQLAQFLSFSEQAARDAGVTPIQYLLLLHVRGFPERTWATVGELAERLQASAHGTAALVKRCEGNGLVIKKKSHADGRLVEVHLTALGVRLLERVAVQHRNELRDLRHLFRIAHVTEASDL